MHDGAEVTDWSDAYDEWDSTGSPPGYPGRWQVRGQHHVPEYYEYWVCDSWFFYCWPVASGSFSVDLGTIWDTADVCVSIRSIIDQKAINTIDSVYGQWPAQEPYERGVSLYCAGNDNVQTANFRDSFGWFYGPPATNDPCAVYVASRTPDMAAIAHIRSSTIQQNISRGMLA